MQSQSRLRLLSSVCVILMLVIIAEPANSQAGKTAPKPRTTQTPKANPKPKPAPKASTADASNPFLMLFQDPELLAQFGHLYEKLETGVHFPPPRSHSRLMSLLPASTVFYAALPNYGEAAQEGLDIFQQEMKSNPGLRQWWGRGDMSKNGLQFEDAVAKFHRLAQYLGDEIVVAGAVEKPNPGVVVVAQVTKEGLKPFLQQLVSEESAKTNKKPAIRILDARDLAAMDLPATKDFLILVRPDYVVGAGDIETLRRFNAQLDHSGQQFSSTPFGQRVLKAYQDGITVVAAADLHSLIQQTLGDKKEELGAAQRTGFTDVEYVVWEHTRAGGRDISQTEVSFIGPRRGMAAWLGTPKPLDSLDFASQKAIMAISLNLANPARMFDDVRELATSTNPNAFNGVSQMEQSLNISLKNDLLQALTGELTLELDSVAPPAPVVKLVFGVKDAARVQQALANIIASQHLTARQVEDSGTTYNVVRFPMGTTPIDLAYTIVDGYLVLASTPDAAKEAVRLHRTGESLVKSAKFRASLPPGSESGMSAVYYQDPTAMAALRMQQMTGSASPVAQSASSSEKAMVMSVSASEHAVRSESTSMTMDTGAVLVVAAIAIPNLLRSRIAANEASAVGSLRTINTAQVAYRSTFSDRGFAAALGTLAGRPDGKIDADHAGLIDSTLGCTSGTWCEKSGYRFTMTAVCLQGQCAQYVALATPVSASTGARNFCATSDGIIRFEVGAPLAQPIRAAQCKSWRPLQ